MYEKGIMEQTELTARSPQRGYCVVGPYAVSKPWTGATEGGAVQQATKKQDKRKDTVNLCG
jgi:hypothetical protein